VPNSKTLDIKVLISSYTKLLKRSLNAVSVYAHYHDLADDIRNFMALTNKVTDLIVNDKVQISVSYDDVPFDDEEEKDI
jgi:hypothetical protein